MVTMMTSVCVCVKVSTTLNHLWRQLILFSFLLTVVVPATGLWVVLQMLLNSLMIFSYSSKCRSPPSKAVAQMVLENPPPHASKQYFRNPGVYSFVGEIHSQSVQSLSRVRLFATPWTAARQASLSIPNSRSPPRPMFIEWVMPSNHLIFCHPLLLLPSIFPSIRVISNESPLLMRWPKYWSFSFSISPTNEHPGLIAFRMG